MKIKWLAVALLFALLTIPLWTRFVSNKVDERKADEIAQWLQTQKPSPGWHEKVKLPSQFQQLTLRGNAEVQSRKAGV